MLHDSISNAPPHLLSRPDNAATLIIGPLSQRQPGGIGPITQGGDGQYYSRHLLALLVYLLYTPIQPANVGLYSSYMSLFESAHIFFGPRLSWSQHIGSASIIIELNTEQVDRSPMQTGDKGHRQRNLSK